MNPECLCESIRMTIEQFIVCKVSSIAEAYHNVLFLQHWIRDIF